LDVGSANEWGCSNSRPRHLNGLVYILTWEEMSEFSFMCIFSLSSSTSE
jgi:hypothetical protein